MTFSTMQDRLLVRLYHLTLNGVESGRFRGEYIEHIIPDEIPENLVKKLLESLVDDELVKRTANSEAWTMDGHSVTAEFYELTTRGLKYVDRLNDGDDWGQWDLKESYESDLIWANSMAHGGEVAPASDRFVSIDHNDPENVQGISAIEDVVSKAKESNQFKELFADPEDADFVLSEVENTVELIKDKGRASVDALKRVLISRLEWIKEKMPDWAGSASVGQALQWIVELISKS